MGQVVRRACLVLIAILIPPRPILVADERPNVVLIIADDMNSYAFDGMPITQTPSMDRFRKTSITFEHAYCAAPVCGPSRAAMFSGIYPHRTGSYLNGSEPWLNKPLSDTESMPELFRRSGYTTLGCGKLFHAETTPEKWKNAWDEQPFKGGFGPFPTDKDQLAGKFWGVTEWTGPDSDFPDVKNADLAIEFLKRKHQQPFFLCYGLWRPHTPFTAPRRFFDQYDPAPISVPPPGYRQDDLADVPDQGKRLSKIWGERWKVSGGDAPAAWRRMLHGFLANTSFADWNIGRVLEALDTSPYHANTIVIVWSDNGYHMGEKNHFEKATLWEMSARTPLMIRVPRMTNAGQACTRPVSSIDFLPTLIDFCELEPTKHSLDGLSLRPLFDNTNTTWDRPALTCYGEHQISVRDERYRYIRYFDGAEELYDHDTDPHEFTNLANHPELQPVKARLNKFMPKTFAKSLGGRNG